jgi:ferritin-like metal-binding protein YciE
MKTPPNSLTDVLNELILTCYASEKKFSKVFKDFSEQALTEELRSCLSPARNELDQQEDRLAQILKSLKLRPHRISSPIEEVLITLGNEVCGYKKQQTRQKDVQIIHAAKLITYHKVSTYGSLVMLATSLNLGDIAKLLSQSYDEIKNAGAYFSQIEQNILYPAVIKET